MPLTAPTFSSSGALAALNLFLLLSSSSEDDDPLLPLELDSESRPGVFGDFGSYKVSISISSDGISVLF